MEKQVNLIVSTLPLAPDPANPSDQLFRTAAMQAYMVKHNPHVPKQLIYLAIVTQVVAPALVLFGYKTRWGTLWLSGFCVIACVLFHADWTVRDEYVQFLLDFANAGGLLFLFAYGGGAVVGGRARLIGSIFGGSVPAEEARGHRGGPRRTNRRPL